jgi:hypothetical protein
MRGGCRLALHLWRRCVRYVRRNGGRMRDGLGRPAAVDAGEIIPIFRGYGDALLLHGRGRNVTLLL